MEKQKVIIDTDPGVDDSAAIILSLYDEFLDIAANKPGFIKAMWCGEQACEDEIKDRFSASSRCMPFDQTPIGDTCVCCGKPAHKVIYFAKAY